RAERREERLAQFALAEPRRGDAVARLRLAESGHVLERGEDLARSELLALALQALDRGDAHLGAEERVLPEGLLDPPPARVAGDVDHRGERERRAVRAHLAADDRAGALDEVGVEGARQGNRLREAG